MPLVESTYSPPFIFRNYHLATIYSAMLRRAPVDQKRERFNLQDGDFIDIDWSFSKNSTSKLLVVLHGLEGSASRPYVTGLARHFILHNWDVAAINLRGCSGEMNRHFQSYHAGATHDLEEVLQNIISTKKYSSIALNGFSLGGNLMLKYLGETREIPPEIKVAVMVSAPIDLHGSLQQLQKGKNTLYSYRFLRKLRQHLLLRAEKFPKEISKEAILKCTNLKDIDDLYTSKAHAFKDALDYYEKNSAAQFLKNIKIPCLLLNAKNDGFLSDGCYPFEVAQKSKFLYLETPEYGGHVGFLQNKKANYNEERALQFIESRL